MLLQFEIVCLIRSGRARKNPHSNISPFDGPGYAALVIIVEMVRKIITVSALLAAGLLIGCGTSTTEPNGGSKQQTMTGVSSSGYPAGEPKDAGSPALASSTESQYSRDQASKDQAK